MASSPLRSSNAPIPLERVAGITRDAFVRDYLGANRPVIVTDAMHDWKALGAWSPTALRDRFGDMEVQIYDDLFFMVSKRPLRDYLDRYILGSTQQPRPGGRVPYVRWYSKQDAREEFPWSDDVLARLAPEWSTPYFMPTRDLVLPFAADGAEITPVHHRFPARGVFISAQGARTRLHTDPWASDAVLCQVFGDKRFLLFRPQDVPALKPEGQLIDIAFDPAADRFAQAPVEPYADDLLAPGEMILIPANWGHAFYTTSASISITWNFVHRVNADRLDAYVAAGVPAGEARSCSFFAAPAPTNA